MGSLRVVLADDHPGIIDGLQAILRRDEDIEVVGVATNGQEVLTLVQQLSPDLLILDLKMPGYNGLQVVRQLHDSQIPVRLLVLSMYLDKAIIQELLTLGIDGYVTKDEALEWLVPAIREIVQGKQSLSPLVIQQLSTPSTNTTPVSLDL